MSNKKFEYQTNEKAVAIDQEENKPGRTPAFERNASFATSKSPFNFTLGRENELSKSYTSSDQEFESSSEKVSQNYLIFNIF